MTICKKGSELVAKYGGEVFIQYTDENLKTWTYTSNEELWLRYKEAGLQAAINTERLHKDGKTCRETDRQQKEAYPTPTKTGSVIAILLL